ncbi:hypothetical protein EDD36DRAFT_462901 [Exophiala viscosa]|uniref:Uncharacterized protein n=1 Tax=Exophiala viscosa TaxID=2486360 RepID=A0AAN6E089_9EURO|nr:hypothetical protein EDD36DRAFT_462901 [Exophiala viscosa]
MPAELPGYYYDASANRYFKIQPNHIAPSGANYSRQAVNAQKVIQKSQRREEESQLSKQSATVSRSSVLKNPLLNFERRLGKLCVGTIVAEYYAASLKGADAIATRLKNETDHRFSDGSIKKFAIARGSGALLAALAGPHVHEVAYVSTIPRRGRPLLVGDLPEQVQNWSTCNNEDLEGRLYDVRQNHTVHYAYHMREVCCIVANPYNSVCWATVNPEGDSEFGITHYDESFLPNVRYAIRGSQIMDLAVSPTSGSVAMATSDGISIYSSFDKVFSANLRQTPVRGEQMVVEFKDEWVVMSGARNGRLVLCDVRSPDNMSAVFRIQHSSAISGLAPMPDGHQILVNGLLDMKIYDLRYLPAPVRSESPRKVSKSRSRSKRPAHYAPTTPVLTFSVPEVRHQNQYGLGFAYDPELNVVVRASTDHVHNHRVGIWSASSGRLLKSPLNEHKFTAPVTCAQIERVRDGPKSILLASDGLLTEWCVQGRGFENEQEVGP